MTPKGRKKGSRNKRKGLPNNMNYWRFVFQKEEDVNAFLSRGDKRQKNDMKDVLTYFKKHDSEFFNEINGQKILKELKNG